MIAGRYSLGREIGRGGMGAVWLGRDEVLGRVVAIKQVGAMPGGSSPDLVRAEREARIAARVNHPHVVAIFDLVAEDDSQWLVMEYVEGTTLAELIRDRGSLKPDEAAPLMAQAGDALTAAHAAGIVHRDVKPSNMLVTPDGQVKLSDFGIARAEADASLTQTGLVTGSPAYISPEVASGRPATDASDVWSLGATMYHALAGRTPYEVGDNVLGALYRIVHEEPPRLENAGWLTPTLEATMTRDPAARPTMAEVTQVLRAGPSPARRQGRRQVVPVAAPAEATQVLTPPAAPTATEPSARPEATPRERTGRRIGVLPALVGVAVVALVVLIVVLLLADDPQNVPIADPPSTESPSSSTPSTTDSANPTPPTPPRPREMTQFARDYVQTASGDPSAGYALLTPAYQDQSPEYEEFWGQVSNPMIQAISADPTTLTVTYTYTYDFADEGEVTETVQLQLEQSDDGSLLIAGAA